MTSLIVMIGDTGHSARWSLTPRWAAAGQWLGLGGRHGGSAKEKDKSPPPTSNRTRRRPTSLSPAPITTNGRSIHTSLSPPIGRRQASTGVAPEVPPRKAQTLPVGTAPPARSPSSRIGTRIKKFFRYTVLRQPRNSHTSPQQRGDDVSVNTETTGTSSSAPSTPELHCLREPVSPPLLSAHQHRRLSGVASDISNISSTDSVAQPSSTSSLSSTSSRASRQSRLSRYDSCTITASKSKNTQVSSSGAIPGPSGVSKASAAGGRASSSSSSKAKSKSQSPLRSRLPRLTSLSPRRRAPSCDQQDSRWRESPNSSGAERSKIPRRNAPPKRTRKGKVIIITHGL